MLSLCVSLLSLSLTLSIYLSLCRLRRLDQNAGNGNVRAFWKTVLKGVTYPVSLHRGFVLPPSLPLSVSLSSPPPPACFCEAVRACVVTHQTTACFLLMLLYVTRRTSRLHKWRWHRRFNAHTHTLAHALSVSLCPSLCPSLYVAISLCLSVSTSLSVCVSLLLSVSICLSVSNSLGAGPGWGCDASPHSIGGSRLCGSGSDDAADRSGRHRFRAAQLSAEERERERERERECVCVCVCVCEHTAQHNHHVVY